MDNRLLVKMLFGNICIQTSCQKIISALPTINQVGIICHNFMEKTSKRFTSHVHLHALNCKTTMGYFLEQICQKHDYQVQIML